MVSQVVGHMPNNSEYKLTTTSSPYGFGVRLVGLDVVTRETGLPRATIQRLAKQGLIPALKLGGRLRFNLEAVNTCLLRMAENNRLEGVVVDADVDLPDDVGHIPY